MDEFNNDRMLMNTAAAAAKCSRDERKVGCVIVGERGMEMSSGWNDISTMFGVEARPERMERPEKYYWIEHAERSAIYEAARFGRPLEGATMYVTWFPCMDCARGIVETRIKALVYGQEPDLADPKWGSDSLSVEDGFNISQRAPFWSAAMRRGSLRRYRPLGF